MAMKMSSSQREMVHAPRPLMSAALFSAAMKGKSDVLLKCLGQLKEQKEVKVTIEASDSAPDGTNTKHQTVQSDIQSATRFGDTILHLLVTKRHNELALKVFQCDMSLLKVQNKMLETPLHCAAKARNVEVIQNLTRTDLAIVKDALEETNKSGDTALHVAAKHGHTDVGRELMKLNPEMAYEVNNEMSSVLYIAIIKNYTPMVQTMLEIDPTLACTKFYDGMFPVHVAARMGSYELVLHFMQKYPDDAELLDPRGRNLLHIAVEESQYYLFCDVFEDTSVREMIARMNNATDYEGNTPLHIAAMKGHSYIMRVIWEKKMNHVAETVPNNEGLTPLQLSVKQLLETSKEYVDPRIPLYISMNGCKFTQRWFDIMEPSAPNKWERTQVIGLGSVLITTVTFSAAITIPGGYNQDNGTPLLGRRYMFRLFILANALSFIQGFLSLFALLISSKLPYSTVTFAELLFRMAASSMVVTFGLGMYVTLAPVCYPIAVLLLVITLILGSPVVLLVVFYGKSIIASSINKSFRNKLFGCATYFVCFLLIFCLAFL